MNSFSMKSFTEDKSDQSSRRALHLTMRRSESKDESVSGKLHSDMRCPEAKMLVASTKGSHDRSLHLTMRCPEKVRMIPSVTFRISPRHKMIRIVASLSLFHAVAAMKKGPRQARHKTIYEESWKKGVQRLKPPAAAQGAEDAEQQLSRVRFDPRDFLEPQPNLKDMNYAAVKGLREKYGVSDAATTMTEIKEEIKNSALYNSQKPADEEVPLRTLVGDQISPEKAQANAKRLVQALAFANGQETDRSRKAREDIAVAQRARETGKFIPASHSHTAGSTKTRARFFETLAKNSMRSLPSSRPAQILVRGKKRLVASANTSEKVKEAATARKKGNVMELACQRLIDAHFDKNSHLNTQEKAEFEADARAKFDLQ